MQRLHGLSDELSTRLDKPPLPPLQRLIAEIERATANPLVRRHRAVAAALQPYLGMPDLLRDIPCPCSPDRYVRHVLHAGLEHTVLALVWRPGQMSPVHGHRSWCALGIHQGYMTETLFAPGQPDPVPRSCAQRRVGNISHAPADPNAIHRLANLGTETAISIHVYGARHDRLGDQVNHVWAV
jgi:predicted metal-dependent enzyme (double-stranded beta helix superfamily)